MIKKCVLFFIVLFFLLSSTVSAGVDTNAATISREDCKITCTNEFTGEEHTISGAITATAYETDLANDDWVEVVWDVYFDDTLTYTKTVGGDTDENTIIMPLDPGTPDGKIYFTKAAVRGFFEEIIKLMYASSVSVRLLDNYIEAMYTHKLDMTCTKSYITMGAATTTSDDDAFVWCNIYNYDPESDSIKRKQVEHEYLTYAVYCDDCEKTETAFYTGECPWSDAEKWCGYEQGDVKEVRGP